jgi:hypothetical protein
LSPSGSAVGAAPAVLAAVGALGFFGGVYLWPMTPRKLFFRDMQRVELGVSRSEVRAIATRWRSGMPVGLPFGFQGEPPPHYDVFRHGQGGQLLGADRCQVRHEGDGVAIGEFIFDGAPAPKTTNLSGPVEIARCTEPEQIRPANHAARGAA